MFVGRKRELQHLEAQYQGGGSTCTVLYGRRGIGKTELVRHFLAGKDALYYQVGECSEREQFFLLEKEWGRGKPETGDFYALLRGAMSGNKGKRILVLDEFHKLAKNGESVLAALGKLLAEREEAGDLMLVLLSSSIQWVENQMAEECGGLTKRITSTKKVQEFSFLEMVDRFPDMPVEECIRVYGILGGVPAYLNRWDEGKNAKENVKSLFLAEGETFSMEVESYLKSELRELSLYNTMLAVLAEGKTKLNDVHERTGFSRAKISVYLKNLIQMDAVEKTTSYRAGNYGNAKKGLYAIREPFLYFWYRFCFPNQTRIQMEGEEVVWKTLVEPDFDAYMERFFVAVCKEYVDIMNRYQKLPFAYHGNCGSWYGKSGDLHLVAQDKKGRSLVGTCKWSSEAASERDLVSLLATMESAGLDSDYYYLFSKSGFTDSMVQKSKQMENIVLTDMSSL